MTLDEAITHALEQAKKLESCECGKEHKQLADWLIDYKKLRLEKKYRNLRLNVFKKILNFFIVLILCRLLIFK